MNTEQLHIISMIGNDQPLFNLRYQLEEIQKKQMLEFYQKFDSMREEAFEKAIREVAIPPVKGKITRSKLRLRGIRICQMRFGSETWLEQRGVRISPIFKIIQKDNSYAITIKD